MENYELAVQSVKATLFDRVYREQGLVDIINKKLDGYSPEVQERLSTLFTKQKENIESVLGLLSEFEIKMGDILSQSQEILAITNGSNKEVVQEVTEKVDVAALETGVSEVATQEEVVTDADLSNDKAVTEESSTTEENTMEVQNSVAGGTVEVPAVADAIVVPNVSTDVASADQSVVPASNEVVVPVAPAVTETADYALEQGAVDANATNEQVEVPVVNGNVVAEQAVESSSEQPVVEVPTTEVAPVGVPEVVPNVSEQPTAEVALPVTEVVQIPGQTNALEDEPPIASGEFVLSPIDEGVAMSVPEVAAAGIAAADSQLQAVENVKNEIAADLSLTPEQKDEVLEKYTRMTAGTVKAILVTKSQYEKLLSSRETQKALLNAKNSSQSVEVAVADSTVVAAPVAEAPSAEVVTQSEVVVPTAPLVPIPEANSVVPMAVVADNTPVVNVESQAVPAAQADEQTLIANGLLAPTAQDKQKEMQTMIEQANELYKSGKTQEAQELFNKVSVMNKELQAGEQGQILVKS